MNELPDKFGQLLTQAIYKIRLVESTTVKKKISIVQDELGYALGREGGSCIEYWRKGNVPASLTDLETLARELVQRAGLTPPEIEEFLRCGGHPYPARLTATLFPDAGAATDEDFSSPTLAPFVVGPPITHPRQFFGRRRELTRIFGLWKHFPLQNVAIVGRHRAGKSSLLHYLADITTADPARLRPGQRRDWLPRPERYRWVRVDFQDARMGNRTRLLRHLLAGLGLPPPEPCSLNNFLDVVSQQLQQPALILMDEIGAGLASPELDQQFWWSLRSLGSNYTAGRLGFLLTAHEVPALLAQEHGKPSPFFNIFGHTLELGPLTDEEARELLASSPRPFAPADVAWIIEQSGRWPALLQILADTRLAALQSNQPDADWQQEGLQRLTPFKHLLREAK